MQFVVMSNSPDDGSLKYEGSIEASNYPVATSKFRTFCALLDHMVREIDPREWVFTVPGSSSTEPLTFEELDEAGSPLAMVEYLPLGAKFYLYAVAVGDSY